MSRRLGFARSVPAAAAFAGLALAAFAFAAACGGGAPPADAPRPPGPLGDASPADLVDGAAAASTDAGTPRALAAALVGVWTGTGAPPPAVERLVIRGDGTFVADVDTGVRCVTAPCPSHVAASGHFRVTDDVLELRPHEGDPPTEVHGRYRVRLAETMLTLEPTTSRAGAAPLVVTRVPPVFGDDATALVASSAGGGFAPAPPPGSTCTVGAERYRFERAERTLAFERCAEAAPGRPLAPRAGRRTLTDDDAARVERAARAVAPSTQVICGTDKPLLELTVASRAGTRAFADAFYACRGEGRVYVDGLDPLFAVLRELAR